MNYFIYKFLDESRVVLYVGFTASIKRRLLSQHFTSNGHLPLHCYRSTKTVLYSRCASETDAKIKERYLINKLAPLYNEKMNKGDVIPWEIEEEQFAWKYFGFDASKLDRPVARENLNKHEPGKGQRIPLTEQLGSEVSFDASKALQAAVLPGLHWIDRSQLPLEWPIRDMASLCFVPYFDYLSTSISFRKSSVHISYRAKTDLLRINAIVNKLSEAMLPPRRLELPNVDGVEIPSGEWLIVPDSLDPHVLRGKIYSEIERRAVESDELISELEALLGNEGQFTVIPGYMLEPPAAGYVSSPDSLLRDVWHNFPAGNLYQANKFAMGSLIDIDDKLIDGKGLFNKYGPACFTLFETSQLKPFIKSARAALSIYVSARTDISARSLATAPPN